MLPKSSRSELAQTAARLAAVVQMPVQAGAAVDAVDESGMTALM